MQKAAPRLLLSALMVLVACSSPTTRRSPREPVEEPTFRGLQAYPYSTPVPPLEPTVLDGFYDRPITVAEAGGKPVACRRCAPYRIDAGSTLLRFDRGRFFLLFRPARIGPVCRGCTPPGSFRASGHFVISGDRIELFNDPNCEETRGIYTWERSAGNLILDVYRDLCFGRLRSEFLTLEKWALR